MPITLSIDTALCNPSATVHVPIARRDRHVAILYLHGGGLLYGDRDDLPEPYRNLLLDAGYTLYYLDYPLAPEATLDQIRASLVETLRWFAQRQMTAHGFKGYFLFGRSAGAYLALLLAKEIRDDASLPQPAGILSFYGFHNLQRPFFCEPSAAYAKLPPVLPKTVEALAKGGVTTNRPKALGFALYVHARQRGAWSALLGVSDDELARFSLSESDIAKLPPLFVTASTADADVPFSESKQLARLARRVVMKPVYDLEHDFDRDTGNPVGLAIYREAIVWMQKRARAPRGIACQAQPMRPLPTGAAAGRSARR